MVDQLFVQSLAIFALLSWAVSYHFKSRKSILLAQLVSVIFWITHFGLLGAYTGAALSAVAALRLIVFSFKKKNNWVSKPFVLVAFIVALIVSTILTFSTFWGIFALAGGIFATLACWQYDQNKIRLLFIPSHVCWIIYDILVGSYGGAITEAILGLSTIFSLLRKDLKK